ncbi:MAG: tyrosine-type recombinase/integrase, partial [candidate division NC10 bacterium]
LTEAARQELISWETVARIRDEISPKRLPALRKANRSRERILMPKEKSILFEAAEQNRNLYDALNLAFWTGLRQENIVELTEAQVDFTCDPAVIRFGPHQMKNEAGHLVRLAPQAREVLWGRWMGDPANSSRRVFQDFRPAWKRLQRRLEREGILKDFHFHDLRRTYTTYRLGAGIDPKTVQDEVGHQDSRMTMDCYGKALRDPGVRAWAMEHFRFPWDPQPFFEIAYTRRESLLSGGG